MDNLVVRVYVTGVYHDLVRMSGEIEENAFCIEGAGPNLQAAFRDALRQELEGSDFCIQDVTVLSVVFDDGQELKKLKKLSPLNIALTVQLEEDEEAGDEEEPEYCEPPEEPYDDTGIVLPPGMTVESLTTAMKYAEAEFLGQFESRECPYCGEEAFVTPFTRRVVCSCWTNPALEICEDLKAQEAQKAG